MKLVYRSGVTTWEIDQNGHMNVEFWGTRAEAGLAALCPELGLGRERRRDGGFALRAEDFHVRFLREQFAGSPLSLFAAVLSTSESSLQVYQEFRHTGTGDPLAGITQTVTLVDARSGDPVALPSEVDEAALRLRVEAPAHGRPRGLIPAPRRKEPTRAEAETLGMVQTYSDVVRQAHCDEEGFMRGSRYLAIVNACSVNYTALTGAPLRQGSHGGAIVEYRWVYYGHPRAGDLLVAYQGLGAVSARTNRMVIWMLDSESGKPTALGEFLSLNFDRKMRRAVDYPPEYRAELERRVIPGLAI